MSIDKDMDLITVLDDLIESTENKRRRSADLKVSDKIFITECKVIRERIIKRRRVRLETRIEVVGCGS
ncbi:hypothetical protein LCGC14_1588490 [marine sediment metagenome]|uniref:Uncharacterized protein n=1 Tax=marine sediment metagenome TaxID=412755 RepID=A0A0F9J0Y4_9ZZZZ